MVSLLTHIGSRSCACLPCAVVAPGVGEVRCQPRHHKLARATPRPSAARRAPPHAAACISPPLASQNRAGIEPARHRDQQPPTLAVLRTDQGRYERCAPTPTAVRSPWSLLRRATVQLRPSYATVTSNGAPSRQPPRARGSGRGVTCRRAPAPPASERGWATRHVGERAPWGGAGGLEHRTWGAVRLSARAKAFKPMRDGLLGNRQKADGGERWVPDVLLRTATALKARPLGSGPTRAEPFGREDP